MKIKGTIINSVLGFVKENFPNRFQEWSEGLSSKSKAIYTKPIIAAEWYSYEDGLIGPSEHVARLFYNNDEKKAAWQIGRYSADVGLKGIYKVFILIGTPQFIMKRAGKILSSFYDPSVLILGDVRPTGVDLHLTLFPEPSLIAEYRIAGWIEKALELCRVKSISIKITKSLAEGDDMTVYEVDWKKS